MSNVMQFSLLFVGVGQLLYGPIRNIVLMLGLVGLFVPYLVLQFRRSRQSRAVWIYFILLITAGAIQSITTGDLWPIASATVLTLALLALLSIAPDIVSGMTSELAISMFGLFVLATAYASIDSEYIESVRSSAPPLALAVAVIIKMTCRKTVFLAVGALLFAMLVFVWDTRAEALAIFVFLATSVFLQARGFQKVITVAITATVLAFFVVSEFWVTALKLQDSYRGLDSGLTGRVGGFLHSLELIKEYPLFGVGYRRQEMYFQGVSYWNGLYNYPISSTHNGVLAVLVEWGTVGSLLFLAPVIGRWSLLWRNIRVSRAQPILLSFLVFIMFERYYLNFGNLYSIIMISLIVCWLRWSDEFDELTRLQVTTAK